MREIRGSGTHGNIPHAYATFRTPRPWTFSFEAGLLARGSSHPSHLPETFLVSVVTERMLVAHSCGGSFGIALPFIGITHRIPVLASDANRKNLEH
jgi:hypothetical protein